MGDNQENIMPASSAQRAKVSDKKENLHVYAYNRSQTPHFKKANQIICSDTGDFKTVAKAKNGPPSVLETLPLDSKSAQSK